MAKTESPASRVPKLDPNMASFPANKLGPLKNATPTPAMYHNQGKAKDPFPGK